VDDPVGSGHICRDDWRNQASNAVGDRLGAVYGVSHSFAKHGDGHRGGPRFLRFGPRTRPTLRSDIHLGNRGSHRDLTMGLSYLSRIWPTLLHVYRLLLV